MRAKSRGAGVFLNILILLIFSCYLVARREPQSARKARNAGPGR